MSAAELDARKSFFQSDVYPGWPGWLPIVAFILYVVSVVVAFRARDSKELKMRGLGFSKQTVIVAGLALNAAWALGPPLWFLVEYSRMHDLKPEDLPDIEAFKYSQDLARNIWLAAVGTLAAIYSGAAS